MGRGRPDEELDVIERAAVAQASPLQGTKLECVDELGIGPQGGIKMGHGRGAVAAPDQLAPSRSGPWRASGLAPGPG